MKQPISIVIGGQYGSEAKGAIAAYLCETEGVDCAVRTGAVNAGHTVYYQGQPFKMQQLPTGWTNPDTQLVIGAGALIHMPTLEREVAMVTAATGVDVRDRLYIDYRAGVHTDEHTARSAASGRHHDIGATGKGCSEALIDRIKGRNQNYQLFGQAVGSHWPTADTAALLNGAFDDGRKILLEATQGSLLDLYFGPYPFTTHKPTSPAVWMAEAGLSPALPTDIVMVVRTLPIRVAGNSGPMPHETSWPKVARMINGRRETEGLAPIVSESAIHDFEVAVLKAAHLFDLPPGSDGLDQHNWNDADCDRYKVALSELHKVALESLKLPTLTELGKLFEYTTVTRKLRRVSMLSMVELGKAMEIARPHRIAVTFMNYMFPEYWYQVPEITAADRKLAAFRRTYSNMPPVHMTSWGPESRHIVRHSAIHQR